VIQTIRNAWRIPDLRKKILFTVFILLIFRLGSVIPVPFIDANLLANTFASLEGTVFGMMNMMSGGAFSQATIFALGVQPYINSSIIMQLLTIAIPALERMAKEGGEEGKKKIASITRYVTVGLGLLMGFAYYVTCKNYSLLQDTGIYAAIVVILTFTAGSAFIMWLGEQITEFGIGNGISIILFASIIARFPTIIYDSINQIAAGELNVFVALAVVVLLVAIVIFVVFITKAERRIPVQYAKRVVGRKMYGGQSTHLPLKVNMSGVMPIIFAQSIASLPQTISLFFPAPAEGTFWYGFLEVFSADSLVYAIIYLLLIVGFSYFYSAIQFNPVEIANNMKQNGGFVPGFRPGRPTADFIRKVMNKITLFGAIFLGVLAILPIIMNQFVSIAGLSMGGTSVMIVVGVALETVQAMESQMMMRHYKGFLE